MKHGRVQVLTVPLAAIVLAVIAAAGAALFMSAGTTYAEISGPCTATIAGVDVAGVNSGNRSDDIHVSQDQAVVVGAISPVGFQSHKIELEFASRRWTVSEEEDDGSPAWSGTVNVDDYATWGVGLYKVIGVSTLTDGTRCEGAATVDVGGNPLTTVAGGIAAGAAAAGTLGGVASAGVGALGRPGPLGRFDDEVFRGLERAEQAREAGEEAREQERQERQREAERDIWSAMTRIAGFQGIVAYGRAFGCACVAALAILMMPLVALTGGGAPGASGGGTGGEPPEPASSVSEAPRRLPRAPWLPRITLLGLVSGLLAGAGIVVLLQQYSIAYPTLGLAIMWLVIGAVVYGLVLPTIGYTIRWLRVNRRVNELERALGWK